jgi:hypothetical protein
LQASNKEYWNFYTLLEPATIAKLGQPLDSGNIQKLVELCKQSTPLDFIFQAMPTFTPAPHAAYGGMIDFMVNNRWCYDYVKFCDRMNSVAPMGTGYPTRLDPIDLGWMIGGAVVCVACVITCIKLSDKGAVAPAPQAKEPAAVS